MKNAVRPLILPILLAIGLVCSLTLNIIQYTAQRMNTNLKGTYSTDMTVPGTGETLVFDGKGNYCRYNPSVGVLESGTYVKSEKTVFL